jgi:polysaccharide chain length determinant protein (PEP-CTERM system associated)
MNSNAPSLGDLLTMLVKEGKRRILMLTALFAVTAILGLGIGLSLPKRFDAQTILLAEASNIIKPLMEGRAVATGVSEQVAITTQVVLSRKILRELLLFGGWVDAPPAPQPLPIQEEQLLQKLKARIKIDSPREEMIRIAYHDTDPARTLKMANRLAEIYMRESTASKERESRDAYDFIDKQVKEYGNKLADSHEKVLSYYRGEEKAAATPSPTPTPTPAVPGVTRPKVSPDQLAAWRAEETTLAAQLARTRAAAPTRQDLRQSVEQYRNRSSQIQAELDRLLATYTENHPDVKRVRRELAATNQDLLRAEQAATAGERAAANASALDDEVTAAARARLESVRARISAATGRRPVAHAPRLAAAKEVPVVEEMRGVGTDTTLSELLRRYEATRDMYQDLLKRRENARVSMELDAQHRGFTLRVHEPAEMPAAASSLRLMHLSLIGLFCAVMVPFAFLFLIVKFDRRVRTPQQIERLARVPLLVSIGYAPAQRDRSRRRARGLAVALMVAGVFAVYIAAFLIKLKTTS